MDKAVQRWNTLLDTLYKHYISKILRIFSEDLPWNCLSGTHSPVFHLQTCANSLTLRESYLLVVWTTECVRTVTHKMTQPERILSASPLCVHVNVGKRVVCQLWAHESDSRYSRGLACYLAWLLWHKVSSLLHFILTLWSSFTSHGYYFTSSWSKELESTCPGLVTHVRESINCYRFSSSFCKALSQSSTPPWNLSCLSQVRVFHQSDWHSSPYPTRFQPLWLDWGLLGSKFILTLP